MAPSSSVTDRAIVSYHAHVYFSSAVEREHAALIRDGIAERFVVQLGRWHDKLVGPHTLPMYQVAFDTEVFAGLVPWLMLHRLSLSILVHPNTGAPRGDHLVHALWLGRPLEVLGDVLPESSVAIDEDRVVPNTTPVIAR